MAITTKEQLIGTWTFKDTIDMRNWQIVSFRVTFISDGKYYNEINCYNQSSNHNIDYINLYTTKEKIKVYDTSTNQWTNQVYKTIEITSTQDLQNPQALIDFINLNTVEGGGSQPQQPSQTSKAINLDNMRAFKSKCDLAYQKKLVSGTDIKTINGESLLGKGDIVVQGGGGLAATYKKINLIASQIDEGTSNTITFTQEQMDIIKECAENYLTLILALPENSGEIDFKIISSQDTYIFYSYNLQSIILGDLLKTSTVLNITDNIYVHNIVQSHNLKTINNQSLIGTGNITIQGGGGSTPKTIKLDPNKMTPDESAFLITTEDSNTVKECYNNHVPLYIDLTASSMGVFETLISRSTVPTMFHITLVIEGYIMVLTFDTDTNTVSGGQPTQKLATIAGNQLDVNRNYPIATINGMQIFNREGNIDLSNENHYHTVTIETVDTIFYIQFLGQSHYYRSFTNFIDLLTMLIPSQHPSGAGVAPIGCLYVNGYYCKKDNMGVRTKIETISGYNHKLEINQYHPISEHVSIEKGSVTKFDDHMSYSF